MADNGSDATLHAAILSYLESKLRESKGKKDVDEKFLKDVEFLLDVKSSEKAPQLDRVFDLGLPLYEKDEMNQQEKQLAESPTFKKFVDSLVERGYFKGTEPGTPEYRRRYSLVVKKYLARTSGSSPSVERTDSKDDEEQAETLKAQGNAALKEGNHSIAVELYSEAIRLCPKGSSSHIYYSNRSAAYFSMGDYEKSASDAQEAVDLKPDFAKAYVRLGTARYYQNRLEEAQKAYETALEKDPANANAQKYLADTKRLIESGGVSEAGSPPAASSGGAPPPGGSPFPGGFPGAGAGGLPAGLGGLGDLFNNPGVREAMNNPEIMRQAAEMMQNPAMVQQMSSMFGSMFGGGQGGGGGDSSGGSGAL